MPPSSGDKDPDVVHLNVSHVGLAKGLRPLGRPRKEMRIEVSVGGWKKARTLKDITNKVSFRPVNLGESWAGPKVRGDANNEGLKIGWARPIFPTEGNGAFIFGQTGGGPSNQTSLK